MAQTGESGHMAGRLFHDTPNNRKQTILCVISGETPMYVCVWRGHEFLYQEKKITSPSVMDATFRLRGVPWPYMSARAEIIHYSAFPKGARCSVGEQSVRRPKPAALRHYTAFIFLPFSVLFSLSLSLSLMAI